MTLSEFLALPEADKAKVFEPIMANVAIRQEITFLRARLAEASKLPEQWRYSFEGLPDQVYQGLCYAADDLERVIAPTSVPSDSASDRDCIKRGGSHVPSHHPDDPYRCVLCGADTRTAVTVSAGGAEHLESKT